MRSLFAVSLVLLAAGVGAQESVAPARGTFLVSKSPIDKGPFHQSVVFLLKHDDEGTLGLIVNRRTDVELSEALPDLDTGDSSPPLFFGGPVALEGLVVLFRSQAPPEGAEEVLDGLYYSGERRVLEVLFETESSHGELRMFVGHSGWAPGQLAAELRTGAWDVQPADSFTLFRTEPEWLWQHLTEGGRTIARGRDSHGSSASEHTRLRTRGAASVLGRAPPGPAR